jgi:D-alanyl-lipoteichoic acid acyltransferase DltB (MBOAT superfamily)
MSFDLFLVSAIFGVYCCDLVCVCVCVCVFVCFLFCFGWERKAKKRRRLRRLSIGCLVAARGESRRVHSQKISSIMIIIFIYFICSSSYCICCQHSKKTVDISLLRARVHTGVGVCPVLHALYVHIPTEELLDEPLANFQNFYFRRTP